jgi:hypothetical protein
MASSNVPRKAWLAIAIRVATIRPETSFRYMRLPAILGSVIFSNGAPVRVNAELLTLRAQEQGNRFL